MHPDTVTVIRKKKAVFLNEVLLKSNDPCVFWWQNTNILVEPNTLLIKFTCLKIHSIPILTSFLVYFLMESSILI